MKIGGYRKWACRGLILLALKGVGENMGPDEEGIATIVRNAVAVVNINNCENMGHDEEGIAT